MRIEFDFGFGDLIDTQRRLLGGSASGYWRGVLTTAFYFSFLGLIFPAFLVPHWSNSWKLIFPLIGAAAGAVYFALSYKRSLNEAFIENSRQFMDEGERATCIIELTDSGIKTKQLNTEIFFAWQNVKKVKETSDSIDIFTSKGGYGLIVRKRAFTSLAEQEKFIELLRQNSPASAFEI